MGMDDLLLVSVFILGVMVGGIGVCAVVVIITRGIVRDIKLPVLDAWREEDEEQ